MKAESLPFIVKYASAIKETTNFWSDLDFSIVENEEDKVVIDLGQLEIHYVDENTEPFEEYKFATAKQGRGIGSLIYLEIEGLSELFKKLRKLSPRILTEIKANHWDGREFMFSDPDGYLFVAFSMKQ
ncbi:VOC family protein [Candidatus Dojkabacteria bacterium]|uniref:VOC family protein n=1 Tax=Candidatus Dojkabacteria bacterium TaxID=2099670 RepID=A0A955RH76_9BACT|nr:VOC family protein [Candidatus Dojkabacteria bacterium]